MSRRIAPLWLAATSLLACSRSVEAPAPPPPQANSATGAQTAQPAATTSAASVAEVPAATPPASAVAPQPGAQGAVEETAPSLPEPATHPAPPALRGDDGALLPQTDAKPMIDSAWGRSVGPTLFEAIVRDDATLARPLFFPVEAYAQVKAIERPERDWRLRLLSAFERSIHDYHHRLGTDATSARFVALDVPEARARWMKPGSEGNRLGYYRVLRSQLRYQDAKGREHQLELTSLISWRGEWYIVHLDGFK